MSQITKNIQKWQKKPSARRDDGVFIVEGIKMFREIPKERLLYVVASESFLKGNAELMNEVRKGMKEAEAVSEGKARFETVSDSEFLKLSDTKTPQGILAVLSAFDYREDELLSRENGLFILLENLQDPGNLGTILRSGEACNVTAVIMNRECVDVYNPKVIRATMGSFFRVPFVVSEDLRETVSKIRKKGGKVYAAHLSESVDYDVPDYCGTSAFMIGNESRGLTKALSDAADQYIKIPMAGRVESLNAAMAATILMFETARQRRKK